MTAENNNATNGVRLCKAIAKYGQEMHQLGLLQCAYASSAGQEGDAFRKQRKNDLERQQVEVAKAKATLIECRARDGRTIIEWTEEEARDFFEVYDG